MQIFTYYDYPFDDKNKEGPLDSIHYFVLVDPVLVHPDSHISNDSNILKEWKMDNNTKVILILPEDYYSLFSRIFSDQLGEEKIEGYHDLDYLNRIFTV